MFGRGNILCLVLATAVAACTQGALVESQSVTPDYVIGGGEWNTGGGITAVARVFERGGATVVCGAWTTDRQSALSVLFNEDVMQTASVFTGRTRLVQNLSFMARVPYADNLSGARANCVASGVPWRADFAAAEPRIRFPRVAFSQGGGDDMSAGSGDAVVFRETARASIIR